MTTWKMVALGGIAIIAITVITAVSVASGIDGTLIKMAYGGIGAIVAGIGGYTFGVKRRR